MAYRNTFFRWLFLYSLTFGLTYVLKLFTYLCPETGHASEKKQRGLGVTRLWRSPNAKETVHEGTYNMQRESLMLSRLRLYWEVILENHFPALMDGFFYVRTSNRGLYASSPHPFLSRDIPLHIPGRRPHTSHIPRTTALPPCRRWLRLPALYGFQLRFRYC